MKIKSSDFVLEIGSGDNPHPRADVLVDKYIEGDAERDRGITIDRPLVEADLESLPFKDGCFDYIICRHVMEHINDPAKGLKELMRVGKRGYIESPSLAGELVFGWSFHRWVLSLENGRLVFIPKSWTNPLGGLFHDLLKTDLLMKLFFKRHRNLFYVSHEWERNIPFEIRSDNFTSYKENLEASYLKRKEYEKKHEFISELIRKKEKAKRIMACSKDIKKIENHNFVKLLICSGCANGNVTKLDAHQYICKKCGKSFRVFCP